MDTLTTLQPQVNPRVRMKEIRSLVKDHVTNKNLANVDYLGQLKLAPEDMTRMVIALQDMLTKELAKHKRCREHLLDSQNEIRELVQIVGTLAIDSNHTQELLAHANELVKSNEKHSYHITNQMRQFQQERDAMLLTMKLLNGQQLQPPLTPMSMDMSQNNGERN